MQHIKNTLKRKGANELFEHLYKKFLETYQGEREDIRIFKSPGRVNMIGEHIDYNGGNVLPAAISMHTTVLARRRDDDIVRLMATDLNYIVQAKLDRLEEYRDYKWGNYQLGVAAQLIEEGYKLTGCDMLFEDKVPLGSGLSSSAAIEIATGLAFSKLNGYEIPMKEMAKICQRAEHNYVGVKCGIMDQFASAMGKKNNAILIDCKTLEHRYIPLETKEYKIVISNTNKKRSLGDSAYNERRRECEDALDELKTAFPEIEFLCDLNPKQLHENINLIKDENRKKRAIHVVNENERVLKSVAALEKGNIETFGKFMIESHESLRDKYEVSCKELDVLVEVALKQKGVAGSRMTGAGFGGCTVSLVNSDDVDDFIQNVGEEYKKQTGIEASFYITSAADGGREVF